MSEVVINEASTNDIGRLVAYAEKFWVQTEYAASGIEYDAETMLETTLRLIDKDVVLYAENSDGKVVGLLCVMISPFPMNKNYLSACEWGFYVDEEQRRTGLALRLIERCEEMLREKKVKFFTMIALSNLRPESVGKFYERLGFKLAESCYLKDLLWEL